MTTLLKTYNFYKNFFISFYIFFVDKEMINFFFNGKVVNEVENLFMLSYKKK